MAEQTYQPQLLKAPSPIYPKSTRFGESSGLVEFAYMVNDSGKVFEPLVLNTTHPALIDNALKSVLKTEYEPFPDEYKGQVFRIKRSVYFQSPAFIYAIAPHFSKRQERVMKLLGEKNPNQKRIRRELDRAVANAAKGKADTGGIVGTGMALQQLLEFEYQLKFGNRPAQISALERGAAFYAWVLEKPDEEISPRQNALFTDIFSKLFVLYIEEKRYADALNTYRNLQSLNADVSKLENAFSQVLNLQSAKGSIGYSKYTDVNGSAVFTPLKSNISLRIESGVLNQTTLRCQRHYMHYRPEESSISLTLDPAWGECLIEINGPAETKLTLHES